VDAVCFVFSILMVSGGLIVGAIGLASNVYLLIIGILFILWGIHGIETFDKE